jgi:hypothetical protein
VAVEPPEVERRSSKRVELRLPVEACVSGGRFEEVKLLDVSLRGIAVEPAEGSPTRAGDDLAVRLRSNAAGVAPFVLTGKVVRSLQPRSTGVGLDVSGNRNTPEALASFRRLVLFHLRRKPLLEEIDTADFEGHCTSCDWVGRVSRQSPRCPVCVSEVVHFRA